MKEVVKYKWKFVLLLVYLDLSLVLCWFALEAHTLTVFYKGLTTEELQVVEWMKFLSFVVFPPIMGVMMDRWFVVRKNHIWRQRLFLGVVFLLFLLYCITSFYGGLSLFYELAFLLLLVAVMLINFFHLKVNSLIDLFFSTQKLPLVLAIMVVVIYPFVLLESEIFILMTRVGTVYVFFLVGAMVVHASWLFRKLLDRKWLNDSCITAFNRKIVWSKIVWLGVVVGIGHAAVLELYPKIFMMLNEPHGVSDIEGEQFAFQIFAVVLLMIFPMGGLVYWYGVSRFVKTNNTVLILSIVLSILFPNYFYILVAITAVSLSVALVTNLPVVYHHLPLKNRILGVGVFFSAGYALFGLIRIFI